MQFEDLSNFLRVMPGHGITQAGDDRVETPFCLPGTTEPLVIQVTRMLGTAEGPLLVTDGGVLAARTPDIAALLGAAPEALREAFAEIGAGLDDEGRIFVVAAEAGLLKEAVAAVTAGTMMLATLALVRA